MYRLNFGMWRFRVLLNMVLIYFLWSAVFSGHRQVLGYTESAMLTYVLVISLLSDIVLSSRIHEVGAQILNGDIVNHLLKPIPFFKYLGVKEAADKAINIVSSIVTIAVFILLVKPELTITFSLPNAISFLYFLLVGIAMSFFISFSISLIAFWTPEIWAPRFIYFILIFMLAGNYFPLDILPKSLFNALLLTPFPYFIFLPAKILIFGTASIPLVAYITPLMWVVVLYKLTLSIWRKGMQEYSFYGR